MKPGQVHSDSSLLPSLKLNGIQDPEQSVSLYGQGELAIKASHERINLEEIIAYACHRNRCLEE